MGSLEEEKLVQMVHDFIEYSEVPNPCFSPSSNCLPLITKTHYFNLKDILENETKVEGEVVENVLKLLRSKMDVEKTTSLKKWLVMRLNMDGYVASLCHTSWVSSMGCPAGEYEYIDIKKQDDEFGNQERLILDIDFKSQFELARPTPDYRQLMETLPSIFIGNEDKLVRIISILCSAAKQSLRESGLHLPPWRTTTYMQSKWLSSPAGHQNNPQRSKNSVDFEGQIINGGGGEGEAKSGGFNKWMPPMVKHKTRILGSASAGLSSQFSNMSINCC